MEKKDAFTKFLAILGTIFVWLPIVAPIIFSVGFALRTGMFRVDYLMPAELFPIAMLGGGMLLWAALRARSRRGLIGWGLVIAVGMLFGGQALAVITGLASGETEPTPWLMALVLVPIGIYVLALVAVGIGGVLLMRDLFKHPAQ